MFRYEKELGIYENDEERLEELRETYGRIVEYLNRKMEEGRLTALQCWVIQETTKKVAENLAVHYEKVQKGVAEIMGGQILELECVKRWNAGIEAGIEKGRKEGKREGRKEGRREGKLQGTLLTLNDLVNDGVLTVSEAARRAAMTEEDYVEQIKQLGL